MTAQILDGNAIARQIRGQLRGRVDALKARGVTPGLAVIVAGDNTASKVYVSNKARACAEVGLHSEVHALDGESSEHAVLATLEKLNRDPRIHGIIVQLPLPRGLDAEHITQSIAVEKDADGFNWRNLGALVGGRPAFVPCTPLGVMALLDRAGAALEGRHAVVVGRSNIVGKPLALMLIARGATVTVCNSRTPDLGEVTRRADILVAAAGKPELIDAAMVKPGAVVIDVGINRLPQGGIVGDVAFAGVKEMASMITPVPGGVGPMTVAMLIANTVTAAERAVSSRAA
jgi:methylenetetrahydrofolate dehydrogenase (NADP+) / methenyltetrahydrofolate cyclohydrolase